MVRHGRRRKYERLYRPGEEPAFFKALETEKAQRKRKPKKISPLIKKCRTEKVGKPYLKVRTGKNEN